MRPPLYKGETMGLVADTAMEALSRGLEEAVGILFPSVPRKPEPEEKKATEQEKKSKESTK